MTLKLLKMSHKTSQHYKGRHCLCKARFIIIWTLLFHCDCVLYESEFAQGFRYLFDCHLASRDRRTSSSHTVFFASVGCISFLSRSLALSQKWANIHQVMNILTVVHKWHHGVGVLASFSLHKCQLILEQAFLHAAVLPLSLEKSKLFHSDCVLIPLPDCIKSHY